MWWWTYKWLGYVQALNTQVGNRRPIPGDKLHTVSCRRSQTAAKENKTRIFFLNNFPLVRGLHQFMRAHVCGSLATETSVKHCVQFLPSVGEKKALVVPGYSNRFSTTSSRPFTSIYPQCKHLRDVDDFHSTWMVLVFKYPLNTVKQRQGASTYTPSVPCSHICAFLHLHLSKTLIDFFVPESSLYQFTRLEAFLASI